MTKLQRDVLRFIKRYTEDNGGIVPSFDDIAEGVGLKSKSGVHRAVVALEERGYITRLPNRARAIKVIQENER